MKGVILAGGRGSRLYPATRVVCKQLLPVYDKPMIYYPLSTLLMAGIFDIQIITTSLDLPRFEQLLGDGSQWGITLSYGVQEEPLGIAHALCVAESFIRGDSVALILGDNIFYGHNLSRTLASAHLIEKGALIFGYEVHDPHRYGVLAFDPEGAIVDIIEKPVDPPSRFAVTGLYFYDQQVVEIAKGLTPSKRGELEITDVNVAYLKQGNLKSHLFERGFAWLDTGTPEAMQKAASYIQAIQERQGIKVGCIEEVAYQMGRIDRDQLERLTYSYPESEYGDYLNRILKLRTCLASF